MWRFRRVKVILRVMVVSKIICLPQLKKQKIDKTIAIAVSRYSIYET